MKAIVQSRYGSPEVLELEDVERPRIGPHEVLVRVRAAGVDPGVWHLMTGLPYLVRVLGYGLRAPRTRVRGIDVAGRVEARGAQVSSLAVGDAVFGTCQGSFAEFASAREDRLAPLPEGLCFEQAAALPTSGSAALQGLRDEGRVRDGQRVLVVGAAGGVGSFAVQIARALGGVVTGVCSTAKRESVEAIGAHHVIDYERHDFTAMGTRYDVILDTAGSRPLSRLRRALAPRGTLVIVGGESRNRWLGGAHRMLQASIVSPFVSQSLRPLVASARRHDLYSLKQLVEASLLTPLIDRTYPLSRARDAVRYVANGHARGKVVLTT